MYKWCLKVITPINIKDNVRLSARVLVCLLRIGNCWTEGEGGMGLAVYLGQIMLA